MSLFILDLARVNHVQVGIANFDDWSEMWGDRCRWRVCPECLWLTVSYDWSLRCRRDPNDPVHYGGVAGLVLDACPDQPLTVLPDTVSGALWSALRIGGINAVVGMVGDLKPEDVGLISSIAKFRQRKNTP